MRNMSNALPNNPYMKSETITIGLTTTPKTRVVEYRYDLNGRVRERRERNWNDAGGAVLRTMVTDYRLPVPDASSNVQSITDHAGAYWKTTNRLTDLLRNSVGDGLGNKYAVTEYVYDGNGNKFRRRH